jgi:hypothetical protein
MKKLITVLIICFYAAQMQSQCFPDRHNTSWYDGWISCATSPNPNPDRQESHWILYNFGQVHALGKMQVWNTNDPMHLDRGMKNVLIDYSIDGFTWTSMGSYALDQGLGTSTYEGIEGPDFEGVSAQYVLITGEDNYGDECYGLSEVRFETLEIQSATTADKAQDPYCISSQVYPNPFVEDPVLAVHSNCNKKISYRISDALGNIVLTNKLDQVSGHIETQLPLNNLSPGIYFMDVLTGTQGKRMKMIKID